jgi:type VI secretion system protein VasD
MPDRRAFLILTGAAGLLAACGGGPPGPATVTVNVAGQPGMNPGPDGADRPVTVTLLRLRDAGAFNAADFFALQDPATALAADLVGMSQVAVPPGGSVSEAITMEPEATQLGVMALLRDPAGKVWRTAVPVAPRTTVTASVTLGPGGLALQLA